MSKDQLIVVRQFWHAPQMTFIRPGDPLPDDSALVEKMTELGYVKTQREVDAERNPEAARALSQVEQLEADLTQAQAKISALETQLTAAQSGDAGATLETLRNQLDEAKAERQAAVDALEEQKSLVAAAEIERDEAKNSLTEYESAVGELLPDGLSANARKALLAKGYVGKLAISLLTDTQLDAVDGIAEASIKTLREWSPFAGLVEQPAPDAAASATGK